MPLPRFSSLSGILKKPFSHKSRMNSPVPQREICPILQFLQITDPPEATGEGREKFDRYINIYIYISIYLCIYISITQTAPAQLIGGNCHL